MKFIINQRYKSIPKDLEFELPDFTILTGENGSGKTHLLEAINNSSTSPVPYIKNYIGYNGLTSHFNGSVEYRVIEKVANDCYAILHKLQMQFSNKGIPDEKRDEEIYKRLGAKYSKAILTIKQRENVNIHALSLEHLKRHYDVLSIPETNHLFASIFTQIYKAYHLIDIKNKLSKVYIDDGSTKHKYLKKEEFEAQYGEPPWNVMDNLLEKLGLPYHTNTPIGTEIEDIFTFKLLHNDEDLEIEPNSLSTGERTILSIVIALYNNTLNSRRPNLLLLDEPDAPLHPSLSKHLLNILREEFLEKMNISIIMTTHSVATIACAKEEYLYKISKENKTPTKSNLNDAVKLLSYGVPNFSVSTENRRTIFVESENDAKYYTSLFNILSRNYDFKINPFFFEARSSNGSNCSDVKQIIKNLSSCNVTNVYGLIDYDNKNEPDDNLIVLGNSNRYTIENYIFEPHIMGILMLREHIVEASSIGALGCNSVKDIMSNLTKDTLQLIVEYVENTIVWKGTKSIIPSKLNNGIILNIRKEYFEMPGHDLEALYLETWPQLDSIRKKQEHLLKEKVINFTIDEFPELISEDILNTFKMIE